MQSIVEINRFKTYLYMAILTLILGSLGSGLSYIFKWGLTGTGVFLILAGILNWVAYYYSDSIVLKTTGAKKLEREHAPELFDMVGKLCEKKNVPLPQICLIEDPSMNAFATGRDPKHAAIAFTRGLLQKLSPAEIEGVAAHELSHVKHHDTQIMAVVAVLAGFISLLADVYWHSQIAGKVQEKDRSGIFAMIGMLLSVFAPLTAMFIQLAISRKREFMADAGASEVTSPLSLAAALKKISMDRRPLIHTSAATAHLYISSPVSATDWIERIFSTHPPTEERIAILEKQGGSRV